MPSETIAGRTIRWAAGSALVMLSVVMGAQAAMAQAAFDVAVIRPSSGEVKFEHDGKTEVSYGTLRMHDVTMSTCIQWAYGITRPQLVGPDAIRKVHYDIVAKTDPGATKEQMQAMMRTLLGDRFKLAFHVEKRELKMFTMVVAKGGMKMKPSAPGLEMHHENSMTGMTATSMNMRELADYLSDPLGAPLTDGTGLPGRYDFAIDFTPYVNPEQSDVRPDPIAVMKAALKGELGLELVQGKAVVEVTVVDHVEAPSEN
jgi:uncharacterized protein (TIGR03435 family)